MVGDGERRDSHPVINVSEDQFSNLRKWNLGLTVL
ncbi:MAG: hypothetical protein ACI9ME_000993, partial [Ilumatobacter sp.]